MCKGEHMFKWIKKVFLYLKIDNKKTRVKIMGPRLMPNDSRYNHVLKIKLAIKKSFLPLWDFINTSAYIFAHSLNYFLQ